jgi:hypothetical protein
MNMIILVLRGIKSPGDTIIKLVLYTRGTESLCMPLVVVVKVEAERGGTPFTSNSPWHYSKVMFVVYDVK